MAGPAPLTPAARTGPKPQPWIRKQQNSTRRPACSAPPPPPPPVGRENGADWAECAAVLSGWVSTPDTLRRHNLRPGWPGGMGMASGDPTAPGPPHRSRLSRRPRRRLRLLRRPPAPAARGVRAALPRGAAGTGGLATAVTPGPTCLDDAAPWAGSHDGSRRSGPGDEPGSACCLDGCPGS